MFTTTYGPSGSLSAQRATRAYARVIATLGDYYHDQAQEGHEVVPLLGAEEANLRHALSLARTGRLWHAVTQCLHGPAHLV